MQSLITGRRSACATVDRYRASNGIGVDEYTVASDGVTVTVGDCANCRSRNTGQTYYISTRILAPAERYDEVVAMVAKTIATAKPGDSLGEQTVFGPVATKAQFDTAMSYIESGHAEGARATSGGRAGDVQRGYFIDPAVFADVTPQMRIARQEIFGTVITILRYETLDEAVAIANDTEFGLGGLVFSADPARALAVADRMDTGSVGINLFASNHSAPFGGRRASRPGVEYGFEGLSAYLTYKSIYRKPPSEER